MYTVTGADHSYSYWLDALRQQRTKVAAQAKMDDNNHSAVLGLVNCTPGRNARQEHSHSQP